jgi:hypothetical protein
VASGEQWRNNMKTKNWLIILTAFTLSILFETSLFAINGKSNLATLRGLQGVGVLVEQLPPEAENKGLKKDQIQTGVESRLQKAGIKVLTKEECAKTPGEPYLYINLNINITKTESDIYPYTVDVMLIQKVSLLRDPQIYTYAMTWSTGGIGSIDKQILGQLRESVLEMVNIFVNAYLTENPK